MDADEWNASEDAELHQNEADEDDRPPKGDVAAHEAGLHLDQLLPEFHVSLLNTSISYGKKSVKSRKRQLGVRSEEFLWLPVARH